MPFTKPGPTTGPRRGSGMASGADMNPGHWIEIQDRAQVSSTRYRAPLPSSARSQWRHHRTRAPFRKCDIRRRGRSPESDRGGSREGPPSGQLN